MRTVLSVLLIVAVLALLEGAWHLVVHLRERRRGELRQRLRAVGEPAIGLQILRQRRLANWQPIHHLLAGSRLMESLERLLEQTDYDLTVARLLAYAAAFAGIGVAGGALLDSVPLAVMLGVVGAMLPFVVLLIARRRRSNRLSEQLPEALEMMARALQAGHPLPAAFRLVAHECPMPVAVEFGKAYEQQNLGLSFESAVLHMSERVPDNLDLKIFAVSVVVQRETGGNLVEVLQAIASTIRERFKFRSKLRALTAEARISAWIIGALPFIVAGAISLSSPGYLVDLLERGTGQLVLVSGFALWLFGVAWLSKLSRVEY